MKILLLGTGGYHPNERRHTACLMLPSEGIVLDAGTGFFRVRRHLITRRLDIFVTHAHLDHVSGLPYLLNTAWQRPLDSVTVHGELAKLTAIRECLLDEYLFPAPLPCQWRPLEPRPVPVGGASVTNFPLEHPCGSVGFRLDWPGRSMAYVTDTTAALDAPYLQAIQGVDLLIHECNFRDGQEEWAVKTGHSSATPVGLVAAQAGVKRLVLTHFDSLDESDDPVGIAAVRANFPAAELGRDGMEIEF